MFEWDDQKAASNLAKHGIDFEDALLVFSSLCLTAPSPRGDEMRFATIGELKGTVVVWTERDGGVKRLISARRARRDERDGYRQAISTRSQGG
jgi:uncharacterized DUF497 family protein